MTNSEKMLKHMAWANTEILSKVAQMPDEALDSYVVNPEWTAREIIVHIVRSAHFLRQRLLLLTPEDAQGEHVQREAYFKSEKALEKSADIPAFVEALKKSDQALLEESNAPDGTVYRLVDGKITQRARSTVIFQAIHHATEHRAHLVSALEARGFDSINLDHYALWGFADKLGE